MLVDLRGKGQPNIKPPKYSYISIQMGGMKSCPLAPHILMKIPRLLGLSQQQSIS